ncbi:MAG: ROK family transcriptional regulator [Firmicutes bacterium]|uniref:ROK family transcriptional regulator n=1 Tax=Candidatus Onthovivens merdipullorum TaxID=2840889 RepID=A0A9D9DMU9_9BACL|nr:ROK family transcriptional regulator [Candidatus Onthovivens merdipullorum]
MVIKKELGKKQTFARELNNEIILKSIRKKPSSLTELTSALKLSSATVSSILTCLLNHNIIKVCSTGSINGLGRKRVIYSINDCYGLVVIVSITSLSINITISNMLNETLASKTREISVYDMKSIYETIIEIKDLLTLENVRDIPVRSIIISLPGLINKNTGELQVSPQFDKEFFSNKNNLIDIFTKCFHTNVYLENDSKLMMKGELSYGTFPLSSKGMLIYCDYGIGGAIEFDNKLFLGSRGYAGEVGLIKVFSDGQENYLDEFISLRALKETFKAKYNLDISLDDIFKLFNEKDNRVVSEVLNSASLLASGIIEMIDVFDLDYFLIGGRVTNFGDLYINKIREIINKKYKDVSINFTFNDGKAIIDGAKETGIEYILKNTLKEIK